MKWEDGRIKWVGEDFEWISRLSIKWSRLEWNRLVSRQGRWGVHWRSISQESRGANSLGLGMVPHVKSS